MNRKDEHLKLALEYHKENTYSDFDKLSFVHQVFSEINVDDVDLSTEIAGIKLDHPFYINGMTGGSELTKKYNQKLAILARETNTFMGVGSLSAALKDESLEDSFTITRKENPQGKIFANLGADKNLEDTKKAIQIIEADGIQIHVNVAQEIVMPEGERDFRGWINNIKEIIEGVGKPVIVKEVGFGMSKKAIKQLIDIGAKTIDISGTGGTNFAQIENSRRSKDKYDFLLNYGNSTVASLLEAQDYLSDVQIVASAGIRNSMDIIKSLSLGASAVAMAGRFINLVDKHDIEEAIQIVEEWKYQLKSIMALLGAKNIEELRKTDIIVGSDLKDWCEARNIDYKKLANRNIF
ncbi:type 2 isopentenyl-diphosphate Delta-isomerase [Helcococcus massiliensis]|uniref:type 2 isopentenyl-diphosphate Delta-isomerase n=1 Tax=Helcococcus massiliensis TaxID=2040290 RepID=UPI000CDE7AD1|nr:type 2 isopentenyl-diphosphate Delta-isomerase [Helcococcus massiliensis]